MADRCLWLLAVLECVPATSVLSARGFCSGDFGFGIPERGEGDVRLSMKAGRAHPPRYSQVRQVGDRQAGAVDESLLALSILCGTSDP